MTNGWKKLGVSVLAGAMALTLVGCSNSNSSSSDKKVKITIFQGKVESNKQWQIL
ncbi:hypothetical protein [Lactiplantibacillus plantarum]|uniref:hypothetical protein n=1 Tax=Lactiplantibacillus plantarum TaxID=1590 RepID=UPI00217CD2C8|nr:hypothetical protein [Lactiplantibacillus plantarum]